MRFFASQLHHKWLFDVYTGCVVGSMPYSQHGEDDDFEDHSPRKAMLYKDVSKGGKSVLLKVEVTLEDGQHACPR